MGEDPLNDGRVLDRGDELHPPGTAWTTQDVQVERAPLQGLEGLLPGGSRGATNTATGTNQSATNQSPVNSLIDGLFGPKKK